jgi:hypothetical protein
VGTTLDYEQRICFAVSLDQMVICGEAHPQVFFQVTAAHMCFSEAVTIYLAVPDCVSAWGLDADRRRKYLI